MGIIYKNKKCIDCNEEFTPTSGVQLRCGNYKIKTGCNYIERLRQDREMRKAQRQTRGAITFTIQCSVCLITHTAYKPYAKYCTKCATEVAKKQRANRRAPWFKAQRKNNPSFKIMSNMGNQLRAAIKDKNKKTCSSLQYLGCSIEEWRTYLESKFTKNMNWENHGVVWDIDHIIPLSSFDFTIEDNIYKAFNYTNTQPLDSYINRHVKRNRLDYLTNFNNVVS